MAAENTVQRQIWLALGKLGTVLFRLNSGKAWMSNLGPKGVQRLQDGSVLIKAARPVALGLAYPNGEPVVGQHDLFGWTTVTITPDMVGKTVPVVTAVDAKRSSGGRTSDDQRNFAGAISNAGGIAGIANSPEAAIAIVDNWKRFNCSNL